MRQIRGNDAPRPFLKWAGGKTQLLAQFEPLYPAAGAIRRYIEPFLGSAAVFFEVRRLFRPGETILADGNEELIQVYRSVRDQVEELIRLLEHHQRAHSRSHYQRTRSLDPGGLPSAERAARFIYLNKTCFNGLYRVNRRGIFNVPMGRYTRPPILDPGNLRAARDALQGVDLRVQPFSETPSLARRGDFLYIDPPYHPLSPTSSFTSYTRGSFGEKDQERLAEMYRELSRRGCRIMLSNSDTPFIRDLYRDYDMRRVEARRSINSRAERRGRITELVVLNYAPPLPSARAARMERTQASSPT
jgi:DNA adenine methylase